MHPLGRDLDIDLLIHLLQQETWLEGRIYMGLQAVVNDSAGCSGAWEETSWKLGNKEVLGRKMWMKDMKYEDLSLYDQACQTVSTSEEALNNQTDRMTRPTTDDVGIPEST